MTAAASVLGTCELLEQILLQLPLRQLLLAQRISKTFHELIQDSPSIRRALFLPRASDTAVESHVGDVDGKRRRRKQKEYEQQKTRWRFPGSAQNVKLMVNPFLTTNAYRSTQSNELNDLLSYSPSICCLEPKRNMEVLMTRTRSRQSSYCVKAKFPSNIIRGSWEDMLVTQPPVNGLTIDLYSSFDCNRDEKNKVQGDGRVQGLYEACEESYRTSGCWMSCTLHQSADWMHLTSDVNNVTGAEMLEILSMQYEELAERDYVWRFKGKG